jgi:hypothetical protein
MAAAPPDVFCSVLRDATCHLLDGLITGWAIDLVREEEYFRSQGSGTISLEAAATFVLRTVLEHSSLYQRAGYDMLSITKTGSHTALHVCWNLVEAAPLLRPGLDAAAYDDLARRSLKQVLPLAMGSLGMLCQFMAAGKIEADDHQAIHPLRTDQSAFLYDPDKDLIVLNTDLIEPTAMAGERHYTGCPAFYANGLINLYMEIVLTLAAQYGMYMRLQDRAA